MDTVAGEMRAAGATVIDVNVPDIDATLSGRRGERSLAR